MNDTIYPISEENYSDIMEQKVEPFLSRIRQDDTFISFDGKRIHYEAHIATNPKAVIVISHGFTESAEKFREMAYYFVLLGFSVFAIDHRGHGQSYKIPGYIETVQLNKFSDYIEDFNIFINNIVIPQTSGLPLYLYAHSMGGGIGALYLEQYNDVFSKAVLSSPMICPNTGMPIFAAKTVGAFMCGIGKGATSVPGRCKFNPYATYENSNDTSKPRFDYYQKKKLRNPALRTTGPSFGWANEAVRITDIILKDENCEKIDIPVLIFQPETDSQVLPEYQNEFADKLQNGELIFVPDAKHEIYASTNDVLEKYLNDISKFYNEDQQ